MQIDIDITDPRWANLGLAAIAETAMGAVLGRLGLDADDCEVSILGCDDTRIKELNADFREKDKATNVLSWPAEERGAGEGQVPDLPAPDVFGAIELGDIAISYDTCATEAAAALKPLEHHVTHLVIHGLLHLLGYDHINDADAALMEALETELLETMGIPDPY
ncbi:rRNA maturation RNase YbeY [Pacificibacter marinus]|uniref:Endoribonuclease YbeY n=1 Tax=Pacificibacter marinus TaxID=658057 RepID=A0A1Y5SEZ3_9RHOB|nr:rRNA maturation RNase YbeY [Pacificibacter marinus]SEK54208.1 probable rRNA maturation factor [Pacificibacter marinus]SLN39251.1 Endoribonuclease YbeY [Pacificibacter marinus]